jgi:hypothetical protein
VAKDKANLPIAHKQLEDIVNKLAFLGDTEEALRRFCRDWRAHGEGDFVTAFLTHYGKAKYSRAHVPPGFPIVDLLEQFNKGIKLGLTERRLLTLQDFISAACNYLRALSHEDEAPLPTGPLDVNDHTAAHIRKRVLTLFQNAMEYMKHGFERRWEKQLDPTSEGHARVAIPCAELAGTIHRGTDDDVRQTAFARWRGGDDNSHSPLCQREGVGRATLNPSSACRSGSPRARPGPLPSSYVAN